MHISDNDNSYRTATDLKVHNFCHFGIMWKCKSNVRPCTIHYVKIYKLNIITAQILALCQFSERELVTSTNSLQIFVIESGAINFVLNLSFLLLFNGCPVRFAVLYVAVKLLIIQFGSFAPYMLFCSGRCSTLNVCSNWPHKHFTLHCITFIIL